MISNSDSNQQQSTSYGDLFKNFISIPIHYCNPLNADKIIDLININSILTKWISSYQKKVGIF